MRVAVVSDIHANLPALEAVLEAVAPFDELWVLGDTVGYGPDPDGVIERLRREPVTAVRGNHDAATVGDLPSDDFNSDARTAVTWTTGRVMAESRRWLEALPEVQVRDDFTLVHGSPRDHLWEYLLSTAVARRSFPAFDTRHCLVGHTHVPLVFRDDDGHVEVLAPSSGSHIRLDQRRCILNPGSVGQPRDGDPRASVMVMDTESGEVGWHRVSYPIGPVQEQMRAAGLPERLVRRLEHGL